MPETWINYWYIAKDGHLIKTGRTPKRNSRYVYETAERPSSQISLHTFFCPRSGEIRKLDAICDDDRLVKRREIVREMLNDSKKNSED